MGVSQLSFGGGDGELNASRFVVRGVIDLGVSRRNSAGALQQGCCS